MMDRIISRVERDADWRVAIDAKRPAPEKSSADAIAAAAVQVAHVIGAQAIVAFTKSGSTALRVARERPDCPVLGLTTSLEAARRLALVWGVHAAVTGEVHSMTEATASALHVARLEGFAKKNDEVVVVAGVPFGQPGTTNALRVARV
jgi:pyruvate kinase